MINKDILINKYNDLEIIREVNSESLYNETNNAKSTNTLIQTALSNERKNKASNDFSNKKFNSFEEVILNMVYSSRISFLCEMFKFYLKFYKKINKELKENAYYLKLLQNKFKDENVFKNNATTLEYLDFQGFEKIINFLLYKQ